MNIWNKIKTTLQNDSDKFGIDKIKHFLVCLILSLYSTELAFGAAFAKEYGDKNATGNHWCWWDLIWDSGGILVGTIVRLIIFKRWNIL